MLEKFLNKGDWGYLSNGKQVLIIQILDDNKYLVRHLIEYYDEFGEVINDGWDGELEIVNKVYSKKPPNPIDDEIIKKRKELNDISNDINKKRRELSDIEFNINKLKNQLKTESDQLDKWIINLSKYRTSKRIAFFCKDEILPTIFEINSKNKRDLTIKFHINVFGENDPIDQTYSIIFDDGYNWKKNIVEEIGFLFDISDEDLDKITYNRIKNLDLSKYHLSDFEKLPDKYLTDELKEHIYLLKQLKIKNKVDALEKEIIRKKEEISRLLTNE